MKTAQYTASLIKKIKISMAKHAIVVSETSKKILALKAKKALYSLLKTVPEFSPTQIVIKVERTMK